MRQERLWVDHPHDSFGSVDNLAEAALARERA